MPIENIPEDTYPYSTENGSAVPLDVIKAKSLMILDVSTTPTTIQIPRGSRVATICSDTDCVIQLTDRPSQTLQPSTATHNTFIDDALMIHKDHILSVVVEEGDAHVVSLEGSGTMYIQLVEQWASISMDSEYERR